MNATVWLTRRMKPWCEQVAALCANSEVAHPVREAGPTPPISIRDVQARRGVGLERIRLLARITSARRVVSVCLTQGQCRPAC